MIIRNMDTHSASVFKCNQWFSKTEGDGKLVKEIPAETDGEEMLTSKLFGSAFCHSERRPAIYAVFSYRVRVVSGILEKVWKSVN